MFGSIDNNSPDHSSPTISPTSTPMQTPYLNIDPNYLRGADEYILLEDAGPVRSRVQVMFAVVGTATFSGAILGGLASLRYTGLQLFKGKSTRMQTTSVVLKNGGRIASKFGSVAFLYCACSVICEKSRGVEDELNTVVGGACAGALYSLPSVLNVKKHSQVVEEIEKLGFLRRRFVQLPPVGRFFASTLLGLTAGGLLSFYKNQASDYIKEITSKT